MAQIADRFLDHAAVDLEHLIDHWSFPQDFVSPEALRGFGMQQVTTVDGDLFWKHPGARLPAVRFHSEPTAPWLAIRVEDLDLFAKQNELSFAERHGDPQSALEFGRIALESGHLLVVARRGYAGFLPGKLSPAERLTLERARTAFRTRDRSGGDLAATRNTTALFRSIAEDLGRDRAVEEFFSAERHYWMQRNRAGRWQFARQQDLGIGWANHDHHTYRSSRSAFRSLMELWQLMGFSVRERFYAGAEAGWGAQVLEHEVCRIILFCDLDVAPEELDVDFSATDLPERDTLGTVGLWCALHGGSIGEAGLHHLEAEFDFSRAGRLHRQTVSGVMAPFTDLPMLKQAFTQPEMWLVSEERIRSLLRSGLITADQAEQFVRHGAAGSHLEILQRWEGFKGFNKTGVSSIILATDARHATPAA